jgi:N-methylhydantoinase B
VGEVILEGEGSLLHSLTYSGLIPIIRKKFGDHIYPGDIFLNNDPYSEAAHLPDAYLTRPIFINGELVAWSCSGGHQIDVGGRVAGSCATDSTEIYQEGLRLPPVKLYEKGKPVEDIFDILRANSRVPEELVGDILSHCAACNLGETRFLELVKIYGWETLKMYIYELLDYAERRTREELRNLTDGSYEFTDYMDDDGFGEGPIPIHVKITIEGDSITYDFTGSAPQIKGAMNNPIGTTKGMVIIGLRLLLSYDIPRNGGVWRPVTLIVPKGSILNPNLPGAVAGRGLTLARLMDVMMGAEAKIIPEKFPACECGSDYLFCLGGRDEERGLTILVETIWGGWGGRPFADGPEFNTPILLDGANQCCEMNERLYPFIYNQYGYVPDTEGAGKYRGSLSLIREWEFVGDEGTAQLRVDRMRTRPWGLHGGHDGAFSHTIFNPGRENRELGKITMPLKKGDVIRLRTAGAGGWGSPLERDPGMVLDDFHNEKVNIRRAKEVYGVVINEKAMAVDMAETQKMRLAMMKNVGKSPLNDNQLKS